jgi:diguanylate cyclase
MNWLPNIFLISAGVLIGLMLHSLGRMLDSSSVNRILDALGRIAAAPFSMAGRLFRKQLDYRKARRGGTYTATRRIDPREQQLNDSAQTIRNILLSLATTTQRTDQAASDSSQALGDVRDNIDRLGLPHDFAATHALLMAEIDKVIDSNTVLKRELAHSQEVLATQRQQIESLRTAVRIDGLTQVANRTYFDEKLDDMIKFHQRYNEPLSLVMIDLDNFKAINDTHGHQAGDRILKGVAFKIKSALRESDFLARFGGDEFALILIKAGAQAAADVAWKLCTNMQESRLLLDNKEFRVTLSIGVAEAARGETAESLLKRADEALYRVKEVGRNSVLVADPPENTDVTQPG